MFMTDEEEGTKRKINIFLSLSSQKQVGWQEKEGDSRRFSVVVVQLEVFVGVLYILFCNVLYPYRRTSSSWFFNNK